MVYIVMMTTLVRDALKKPLVRDGNRSIKYPQKILTIGRVKFCIMNVRLDKCIDVNFYIL